MNLKTFGAATLALAASLHMVSADAAPILCETVDRNHMLVDSQYVSSCVDAGVGNVNGNPITDDFLIANPGLENYYHGIGSGTFTQNGATGSFSLDSALWNTWSNIAIGFKFGTGNKPDQWFVYLLNSSVSSGSWDFVNFFGRGGGLSHIQLYGLDRDVSVPEPATLTLLGLGMLGLGFARRRRQV